MLCVLVLPPVSLQSNVLPSPGLAPLRRPFVFASLPVLSLVSNTKNRCYSFFSLIFLVTTRISLLAYPAKKTLRRMGKCDPTYMFSCLTKLEKLLCLKCLGSTSRENSMMLQTMNDVPV
jgi:hypothetical protein